MHDYIIGSIALACLIIFYLYYSTWLLVLPFLPSANPLHSFFPSPHYIAVIPVFAIVAVVTVLNFVIAIVFIKQETPALLVVES
jgi:dolichyl-phosphate mannosyltransferase polypeptide 2 regulatory subunit